MKKKNLLLAIPFFMSSFAALSQAPTLTIGAAPSVGDVFVYFTADTNVSTSLTGANQTWDFSSLNISTTTKSESYVTPASLDSIARGADTITCSNYFPNASTAILNSLIFYLSSTNNQFVNWGYVTPGLIVRGYSDPQVLLTYPFTFNSSVNDTYYDQYSSPFASGFEKGVSTTVGDGWGTLKLPSKTYNNVLRVKFTDVFKDSDNTGTVTPIWSTETYAWYDGIHKQPILKVTKSKGKTVSVLVFSSGPSVGITNVKIASVAEKFEVYPNPVHQKSIISYHLKEKSEVTISLYNVLGEKVKTLNKQSLNAGNYTEEIDVQDLAKGLYIVTFKINGVASQEKLLLE